VSSGLCTDAQAAAVTTGTSPTSCYCTAKDYTPIEITTDTGDALRWGPVFFFRGDGWFGTAHSEKDAKAAAETLGATLD
jgi:hypothetical protein